MLADKPQTHPFSVPHAARRHLPEDLLLWKVIEDDHTSIWTGLCGLTSLCDRKKRYDIGTYESLEV